MREEKNCPCCPNHCDVEHLNCGRGREYFNEDTDKRSSKLDHHLEKDMSSMTLEEKVLYQLRRCGHILHHNEKPVHLDFLSDGEKQSLNSILSKCLDNWK